jgi:hypothetical protein
MKKQNRLVEPGTQEPSLVGQDADIPVAIFKNSLRLWQARWQARKAGGQAVAGEQPQADAKNDQ